ncbi:MAG: hypothetical protein ISR91_01790 [Candidatus Delongbacteria bacterium]|nr:hypothetical protein [Candidatus Delongbacteria bacterium]
MKKILIVLLMLSLGATAAAQIKLSADARVRPRLDNTALFKTNGDDSTSSTDIYWLYRARLNAKAELDGGFMWAVKLGHESGAMWSKMGTPATNGTDWMLAYFGQKTNRFSWYAGRIPLKESLMIDLHYYPKAPVGIPFNINHNSSITGVKSSAELGPGVLDIFYAVDNNNQASDIDSDDRMTYTDQYTLGGGFTFMVGPVKAFLQVMSANGIDSYDVTTMVPALIADSDSTYILGEEAVVETIDVYNPTTYGGYLYPSFAGFTFAGGIALTTETDNAFSGWAYHIGLKGALGPGTLNAWYRGSVMDWDDDEFIHSYLWLDYSMQYGPVTFKPTWRHFKTIYPNESYTVRDYFELTTEINVK